MAKRPMPGKGLRTRHPRGRYTLADTIHAFEVGMEVGELYAKRRAQEAAAEASFVDEVEAYLCGMAEAG